MRHFFILGSNPALSTAEILALLGGNDFAVTLLTKQLLIVDGLPEDRWDARSLMSRLGGTIKIGRIVGEDLPCSQEELANAVSEQLLSSKREGRLSFGLSLYSADRDKPERLARSLSAKIKRTGMEIKRLVKEAGRNVRWATSNEGAALSSVTVEKNHLIEEGGEFVIMADADNRCLLGVTEAVQPFEDFSRTDFGRPDRDALQGMLPPKLARIMLNLGNRNDDPSAKLIMDPFCGSGTVLSEAMKIGFRRLIGSDTNPEAVKATTTNLDWLRQRLGLTASAVAADLHTADAREAGQSLSPSSLSLVVTEPYLGPPMNGRETRGEMQKRLAELGALYHAAFADWRQALQPGAKVVIALPVYLHGDEKHGISINEIRSLGYVVEPTLGSSEFSRLGQKPTHNQGLIYGRAGQHVWREIVRLRYEPRN
jgi:tRNA G10  N-methylase Trm11